MPNELPQTILRLSDNNTAEMYEHGINPTQASESPRYSFDSSAKYLLGVLSGRILSAMEAGRITPCIDITRLETEKGKLMRNIMVDGNVAMILIRPEMHHASDAFVDYLKRQGYDILLQSDKSIDIQQYEKMYAHAIIEPDARPTMPTRTMVYVDSPSKLIVFSDPNKARDSEEHLADSFFRLHKGRQGVNDGHTLRGGIVYEEAKTLGLDQLEHPIVQRAVDPMSAYRHLVFGDHSLPSPHLQLPQDDQLLQYTGVGVHIPDSTEINRDLGAICTEDDLKEILFNQKFPSIRTYNRLWERGEIDKPIVLLISGYAGTGKSTLVEGLKRHFPYLNTMQTGILRAMARNRISV